MDYNFENLNDKEFEILVCDLLSKERNIRIERFKPGKDSGVDGRYFSSSNCEVILQCKHYLKSGFSKLISSIKKDEFEKVKNLKPSQYLFITSLTLSRNNKNNIKEIFSPYILNENDIYGAEDLNQLLGNYKDIEERHYKLWITSTTVLNRVLYNAVKGRSEHLLEQFKYESYNYIVTENHTKAIEHLKSSNVLVLAGEPGIGKTTLANNLSLFFVAKDYEFIAIEESIKEAEDVYLKDRKQIFYFDDFLGSNFLEAIEDKKDSHIMLFIERILRDKSKIFILTSRTTIINNGILLSPTFNNKKLINRQYLLTIDSLSLYEKAQILYNHIWFSDLSEEFIDIFYNDQNYMKIINHSNFNPRIIEFITDIDRINVQSDNFLNYMLDKLNNPEDIWDQYFKVQTNIYIRVFVYLIVFNSGKIGEKELKVAYDKLCNVKRIENSKSIKYDFITIGKIVTNSLIKRTLSNNIIEYSLMNPSIADYIIKDLENDFNEIRSIILSLENESSLLYLVSLKQSKKINNEHYDQIIIEKIKDNDFKTTEINYSVDLLYNYYIFSDDIEFLSSQIQIILNRNEDISSKYKVLTIVDECICNIEDFNIDDIYILLGSNRLDETDINLFTSIFKKMNITDNETIERFNKFRTEKIYNYLEEKFEDIQLTTDIGEFIDDNGYNYDAIKNNITSEFDDITNNVFDEEIDDLDKNDFGISELYSSISINTMIEEYEEYISEESDFNYKKIEKREVNNTDEIHDLFVRQID